MITMIKWKWLAGLLVLIWMLPYCTTTKKAMSDKSEPATPALTYANDIAPMMQVRCTPCHYPDTGKKKFLDTYQAVHDNIDDIIRRVALAPDDPDFMPFKSKKEPLSDSLIQVLRLWKETGMVR
jgi:hypothetical protein